MPAHSEVPNAHSADERPLSRRERRGKAAKQQPIGGKVRTPGRAAVPAAKHLNYRRG
ncbi:hypothetical protein [Nocardia sp. NPDC050406]|uniref:hypothetical protein n=1 Tax=Nocardia sp. NPDC050406 TaxID=3364318 RepID=UPI0037966612